MINDAEDHANPPELGTVERAMKRVKHGRYVLIPAGPDTHGHFSHYYAKLWKPYLVEFLASSAPRERKPRNSNTSSFRSPPNGRRGRKVIREKTRCSSARSHCF